MMPSYSKLFQVFSILFSIAFSSCSLKEESIVSSDFVEFGHDGIVPDKEYVFYPFESVSDTVSSHTFAVSLIVRYTDLCKIKSLPLNIEKGSIWSDSISNFQVELPLFQLNDNSNGKGNFGLYQTLFPLFPSIQNEEGSFISISSSSKDTKGIISMGIITEALN
ncbi:MAG: hypothetical protein J1F16_06305 [Muribaculaceae bacterium]|nr:hypothetical protein [Muribaculaceae bacterium]